MLVVVHILLVCHLQEPPISSEKFLSSESKIRRVGPMIGVGERIEKNIGILLIESQICTHIGFLE
jgi:hypothetical protein